MFKCGCSVIFNLRIDYYSFIIYAEKNDAENAYISLISFLENNNLPSQDLTQILFDYKNFILSSFSNAQLDSVLVYLTSLPEYDYNTSVFIALNNVWAKCNSDWGGNQST